MTNGAWFDLSGRVAVVTGGASGIGHAVINRLAAAGAHPIVADRVRNDTSHPYFACDVTDEDSVAALTQHVVASHGRYDILVTCAGVVGPAEPAWDTSLDEWNRVVEVNLTGVWLTNRAALDPMRQQGRGRIVNLASTAGKDGNPGFGAYSAAKAGVIALTKSLAKEVIDTEIRISSVAPAAVDTELLANLPPDDVAEMAAKIPMGRLGRPEEIAALVHYLVSDEASFTSGACFDASGGRAVY